MLVLFSPWFGRNRRHFPRPPQRMMSRHPRVSRAIIMSPTIPQTRLHRSAKTHAMRHTRRSPSCNAMKLRRAVLKGHAKVHNSQMDVVIALRNTNAIAPGT